jgi:hypothetical protein
MFDVETFPINNAVHQILYNTFVQVLSYFFVNLTQTSLKDFNAQTNIIGLIFNDSMLGEILSLCSSVFVNSTAVNKGTYLEKAGILG